MFFHKTDPLTNSKFEALEDALKKYGDSQADPEWEVKSVYDSKPDKEVYLAAKQHCEDAMSAFLGGYGRFEKYTEIDNLDNDPLKQAEVKAEFEANAESYAKANKDVEKKHVKILAYLVKNKAKIVKGYNQYTREEKEKADAYEK